MIPPISSPGKVLCSVIICLIDLVFFSLQIMHPDFLVEGYLFAFVDEHRISLLSLHIGSPHFISIDDLFPLHYKLLLCDLIFGSLTVNVVILNDFLGNFLCF